MSKSLHLRLLGPPRLVTPSGTVDLPLDRPSSLGYHLACRGDWVRRAELAYLYSPDADESAAQNNLRKLVHRLRQQGWAAALEAEGARLRLRLSTDVQAFRDALDRRDWLAALESYGGPFLDGLAFADLDGYEAWMDLERQDLARDWRTALMEHVRALERQGDWTGAERWLLRLLRTEPLDEDVVQALMRVLLEAGKPDQAREAFERLRRGLHADMGVAPLESTQALADSLRLPSARPQAGLTRPRHNLPTANTRFVGRQRELETLARQLAHPDCRLLTVVGLGGMGKTRLALELACQRCTDFADGVWLAELAQITRSDLLVSSLATAVGLVFSGPLDPKLQLSNYLRGKQMLVVLDNFEHLIEGGLLLEDVLSQAPGLKLLVTSRVALQTASEWPFDLDGLPFPPPGTEQGLDGFDAVRLFVSRAERLWGRFTLTPAALHDIAELTRRVEGMPLALELAATWVRGLSVGDILVQLGRGWEPLQAPAAGVPERQRNLSAILEYSWQLLSGAERSALARLSVFRGGFTLAAAQHVAGAHLGLVLRLINLALVRRGEDGRYELHALVRQFAARRLVARDRPKVMARFSDHFHGQLLALGQTMRSAIAPDTVTLCRRELGNILAALSHLASSGATDRLARSLVSFYAIVEIAGVFKIGAAQIDELTASLEAQCPGDDGLRGGLDAVKAYFLAKIGEDEKSARCTASALARLEARPPCEFLGIAYGAAGICSHLGGRLAQAKDWYDKALAVSQAVGDRSEQCRVLNRLATLMQHLDRHDESNRLYRQALQIAVEIGDLAEQCSVLNNQGINFESTGQVEQAIRLYEQALEISDRIQFMRVKSAALTNLGHVHERRCEYAQAKRYYEQSLDIKRVLGEPTAIAISMTNLADVLYALGDDAAGHGINFQTIEQTLAANARLYTARAVWSLCKYLHKATPERALVLACFLHKTVECEQWVRDEAQAMIARDADRVGEPALRRLRSQAQGMDYGDLCAWLERQEVLRVGATRLAR